LVVILIPLQIFFQIGEFSASLAIIAYAIVPTIRYTEHGLRNVPVDTIEPRNPWAVASDRISRNPRTGAVGLYRTR
jgi:ABC-type proline/glycine betaine transport system permease subunit